MTPDDVELTNLDQPLFEGAGARKRDLVDYLDAASGLILPELRDRPLSVIRVVRGQAAFMQKNLPSYTPEWVQRVTLWAEASKRPVAYALCNDRSTLRWFANQRAIEYHVTLVRASRPERPTHLVLDLDPPDADGFGAAVHAAHVVREVLDGLGLGAAVKTSGAKGVHVVVPVRNTTLDDAAAATRAIARRAEALDRAALTTEFLKADRGGKVFVDATRAGGATVIAAYSPRARPGVPVSMPVRWRDLDGVRPGDFTIATLRERIDAIEPWAGELPDRQRLPRELVDEGNEIPPPRLTALRAARGRTRPSAR